MTSAARAGKPTGELGELPELAHMMTPRALAYEIASRSIVFSPDQPRLIDAPRAPLSAANTRPFAHADCDPAVPTFRMTRTGMILTLGATPATPTPLLATAPTTPAHCVPWEIFEFEPALSSHALGVRVFSVLIP